MLDEQTKEIVRLVRAKSLEKLLQKNPHPTEAEKLEAFLYMLAGGSDGEPTDDYESRRAF